MTSTTRTISTESDAPRAIEEQGGEALTPPAPPTPTSTAPDLPPAFTPNQVERRQNLDKLTGFDRETVWIAPGEDDRFAFTSTNGHTIFVRLYAGEAKGSGFGETARAAYREAYRELRLDGHATADLLKERAGLRRQLDAALDKVAQEAALLTNARREIDALKGRIVELEAERQPKPARDPGTAVLTLAYLRAWLTNAPLGEIQREGLEVLLSLAQPWHARGRAWGRLLLSVQRLGIQVGITPEEASRGR
jgi:hypothetical protein